MSEWISVKDRLPPTDIPVWGYLPDKILPILVLCRADTDEGWLWANCYNSQEYHHGWTCYEAEIDEDYQPTYWMPLPSPPKETEDE